MLRVNITCEGHAYSMTSLLLLAYTEVGLRAGIYLCDQTLGFWNYEFFNIKVVIDDMYDTL